MLAFRHQPFRRKLLWVMMGAVVAAVAIVTGALIAYEWSRFRQSLGRELTTEAAMIGANSAAALAFDDSTAGLEVLAALRARPEIVQAWLVRVDGRVFAQYSAGPSVPLPLPLPRPHQFQDGYLLLCQPVKLDNNLVGQICLRADMREHRLRLYSYAAIALLLMAVSLATAYWVAVRLQAIIIEPLLALTRAVADVGRHKDYGLRVTKQTNDEIGLLIDGFNAMLGEIQRRDEDLRSSEERFRQLAETIQEVFWLRDAIEQRVIYVSPAYERIWGRPAEELYLAPTSWLDGVHPDDRGRVRQAWAADREPGRYDEEFRVVSPDGTVRWVRDRSFPVRGADGLVYRVAGIAEDITERKRLERDILDISEREQRRIGQDIHDGLCQQLIGIGFVVKLLENKFSKANSPLVSDAREIGELLQQTITQARNLSHGLSPVRLDKGGLELALQQLAGNVSALFNTPCEFDCPSPVGVSDNGVATHLYRIAQEAINNAVRHGRPNRILLRLLQNDTHLRLVIEDDGIGIGIGLAAPPTKGIGLHVMRSRARMVGGSLEVGRGGNGRGTQIVCLAPLPE